LRSEHPGLEAGERAEMVARQWAVGHDISFFSFDFTNTCWTRSFDPLAFCGAELEDLLGAGSVKLVGSSAGRNGR
jgi:hypothetical protein